MKTSRGRKVLAALVAAAGLAGLASAAQEPATEHRPRCVNVRADLVEDFSNTGCEPPSTSCFLGVVRGSHFLRGTTRFDADSGAPGPSTSPGFSSYSGIFEYFTDRGTIVTRETGVVNGTTGNPESGAVTAFQKITSATGDLTGATGHFFVSGFSIGGHVETKVTGRVCLP
jgi:hypothetical protein